MLTQSTTNRDKNSNLFLDMSSGSSSATSASNTSKSDTKAIFPDAEVNTLY